MPTSKMGDTVAHAAHPSEDQAHAPSKTRAHRKTKRDGRKGNSGGGSTNQNGSSLPGENGCVDGGESVKNEAPGQSGVVEEEGTNVSSETENKEREGDLAVDNDGGGGGEREEEDGGGNERSVDEGVSVGRDESSENISSLDIDTSGVSIDNNTSCIGDDDTSPEDEIPPGKFPDQTSVKTADVEESPTSEVSSSESGFAESSKADSDTYQAPHSDGSVTLGLKATPTTATSDEDKGLTGSAAVSEDCKQATRTVRPSDSRIPMEQELQFLRDEVRSKATTVQRLQTSLYDQQVRANVAMVSLRTQLRKKDQDTQQLRHQHEHRMSALLSHMLFLEGQMRKEQRQVLELLTEKDDVIRRQKSAIEDLASKNARLLTALKEMHGYSGANGITSPHSVSGDGERGKEVISPPQVVLRNKDKGQKVRFSSVKDKLRRHKSSLELHRPASLDTLMEGTLRYGSQENLSEVFGMASPSPGGSSSHGKGANEGRCSDELKKLRQQERKERCKSLIDYPPRLNDLIEVPSEVEKGRAESPDPTESLQHHHPPPHSPSSPRLRGSPHGRESVYSDEDDAFQRSGGGGGGSGSKGGGGGEKMYGELAKSTSMPQSLSSSSELEVPHSSAKERPHSLSGVELSLNMDKMTMLPMERVSMMPSPTSLAPPVGSESNPFKSIKNAFKRRNSKQRSKKRPVSLGNQTNQEYHEAVKEHFKKYDLS